MILERKDKHIHFSARLGRNVKIPGFSLAVARDGVFIRMEQIPAPYAVWLGTSSRPLFGFVLE